MKNAFKVITLGDHNVGKTTIVEAYIKHKFNPKTQTTLGPCFSKKDIVYAGKNYSFEIWDTAGAERYRSLLKMYYRNSDAVLVVYDVTERKSFQRIKQQIKAIEQNCTEMPCLVVVGNKTDLKDRMEVPHDEVKQLVNSKSNCTLVYSSAKNMQNIQTIFTKAIELIMNKHKNKQKKQASKDKDITIKKAVNKKNKTDDGCC